MPLNLIGDQSLQFTTTRNTASIKADLAQLVDEMSTGRTSDITRELGGDTLRYAGILHSLARVDAYHQAAKETAQTLGQVQTVLENVDNIRGVTAERLLLVSDNSSESQIMSAGSTGRSTFEGIVSSLNTTVADRSLLGGNRFDVAPLAAADNMLADIHAAVGGAVDVSTILARVGAWFDDPVGGFATAGYQGDSGPQTQRRVSDYQAVQIDARADDPGIRQVLKGAAIAALAESLTGLDRAGRSALIQAAAVELQSSATGLVAIQSRIGFAEEQVTAIQTELSAQKYALEMASNEITLADPYETATHLQAVQLQLETAFSITGRMAQLSLLRYM